MLTLRLMFDYRCSVLVSLLLLAGCGNALPVADLNTDPGDTTLPDSVSPDNPGTIGTAGDDEPVQRAPTANAGADAAVPGGVRVFLNGEESLDPDGDELTYLWEQVEGAQLITLEADQSPTPSLLTPMHATSHDYEFRLTVTDGNFTSSDSVVLTVLPATLSLSAYAGEDQVVDSGAIVTLVGSIVSPNLAPTATFEWTQLSGSAVALSEPGKAITTFIAPQAKVTDHFLEFEVRVSAGSISAFDRVSVRVKPQAEDPTGGCLSNGTCDDGAFCNGVEICINGACHPGTPPCGSQPCDESGQSCPECAGHGDCNDGLFCNGIEQCVQGLCLAGIVPCGSQLCNEALQTCVECVVDGDCADGLFCNGSETCSGGVCQTGTTPCAPEFCSESADACYACLTNEQCNDGLYCNGIEVCSNHSCTAGVPPCGNAYCNESTDGCVQCLSNAHCDDGVFCNGAESCQNGQCQTGLAPCGSFDCNEATHACSELVCDGQNPPFGAPVQAGTLLGSVADEASGLVASRKNPNVLWTHNDDTGDNRIFAIHTNGTLLGTYTLGSGSVDPEDIAIGPGPVPGVDYIYWGNTGDNNNVRTTIFVKRVPEPSISAAQSPPLNISLTGVDTLTFAYPTDTNAPAHKDCETLLVDPLNGDMYFVTKRTSVGLVYRAPFPHSTTGTTTLQYVASLDWGGAVGGDVSPDGQLILIRRYSGNSPAASIWTRPTGGTLWSAFSGPRCDVNLASEPQGEAIAWDSAGSGYFTVSENQSPGALIPIWYFPRQ